MSILDTQIFVLNAGSKLTLQRKSKMVTPVNMDAIYYCQETGSNVESCSCDLCVYHIWKYNQDYKNRVKWNYLCYHEIQPQILGGKESNLDFCVKCNFGMGNLEAVTKRLVKDFNNAT